MHMNRMVHTALEEYTTIPTHTRIYKHIQNDSTKASHMLQTKTQSQKHTDKHTNTNIYINHT